MKSKYVGYLNKIVSKVPEPYRDDARQAGLLGYTLALKRLNDTTKSPVKYIDTYVYLCMRNEVLSELATLNGDGRGIISMDRKTYSAFSKYKREGGADKTIKDKAFKKLNEASRIYF